MSDSQSIQLSEIRPERRVGVPWGLGADAPIETSSRPENQIVYVAAVSGFDLRFVPRHILRKEVIQPQVPLRLPCYDFTPVTNHSLGACLPCGLAQPLLEQSTPMV